MRIHTMIILLVLAAFLSFPLSSAAQWEHIGGPGGCSVRSLLVNGRFLFAGTDRGGVWRLPLSAFKPKKR